MAVKRTYQDRDPTEVAVLEALVNRSEEGMTVLELRAAVSTEIDVLEDALAALKDDDLISVECEAGQTLIRPADRVVPEDPIDENQSLGAWLRRRIPL